jgi:predicted HD phosphohydrolase
VTLTDQLGRFIPAAEPTLSSAEAVTTPEHSLQSAYFAKACAAADALVIAALFSRH